MINNITADRIANGIRMQRSQHAGAFLVVEGDTDSRLYKRFVDYRACQLVVAHAKNKAIEALDILEQDSFSGILVIVDADFWVLEGKQPARSNLLLTDTHDLETMILASPALDKFLAEYGSPTKIEALTSQRGQAVREMLIESGTPIGYLRWVSLQDNLALKFEDLSFSKFVDDRTLAVDEAKMIKTVKDHSQTPRLDERELQNRMTKLKNNTHDLWHVCCGHDLICILSIGLRKVLGSHSSYSIQPQVIETMLRLAYEWVYFQVTRLYQSIKAWEEVNHPFKILATTS